MSDPLLTACGLSAHVGANVLLDNVDLQLDAGHVAAVIGKSGSGKTTLGLALQAEHRDGVTLSGSVRLRGAELLGRSDAQRREARAATTAYLPQHPAAVLNPVRRIGKVLGELAALRHTSRPARETAVREALRTAQLHPEPRLLRCYPHQLSGGEQQRVALAQALITEPDIVILDEPTTGLDTTTKAETADMLSALATRGTALVLLTHDLSLARKLAHEAIVLCAGEVVEHGPGTRPLVTPAHAHMREILAAEPRLPDGNEDVSARQDTPVLLRATGLTRKTKDSTSLLEGIDFDVQRGQCVAIVGRSGAGKTTLSNVIRPLCGVLNPARHLARVALPATARQRTRKQRRSIQYVHQDARASFDEHRSVTAQVARTAELLLGASRRDARRDAVEMLETLGLNARQTDRRPSELSGGQLQRAALARGLLARPAVLICDEITSALDVVSQSDLLDVLATVKDTMDTSVVLISHDFTAIAALADTVHVLDDGRRVESASRDGLFTHPESPVARELVAAARRASSRAT